jgi:hypothetical protein
MAYRARLLEFIAVAVVVASTAPVVLADQASSPPGAAPAARWTPPRTQDGQPDLQGTWVFWDDTPFETPGVPTRRRDGDEGPPGSADKTVAEIQAIRKAAGLPNEENVFYAEAPIVPKRRSIVVEPSNGHVPLSAAAAQKNNERQDHFRDSYMYLTPYMRCVTRGVPGGLFPTGVNNAVQFIQTPGYVAIVNEQIHEARIIPLNGSPHLPQAVRLWTGDSRGRWEGNTLVVETTNFNDKGAVINHAQAGHLQGVQQSEDLRVVERFTPVSANTINYEVTIEDPKVFTSPWKAFVPLTRNVEYKMFEYACHEGNSYFITGVLRAGRVREKGPEGEAAVVSESRRAAEQAGKAELDAAREKAKTQGK